MIEAAKAKANPPSLAAQAPPRFSKGAERPAFRFMAVGLAARSFFMPAELAVRSFFMPVKSACDLFFMPVGNQPRDPFLRQQNSVMHKPPLEKGAIAREAGNGGFALDPEEVAQSLFAALDIARMLSTVSTPVAPPVDSNAQVLCFCRIPKT